MSLDYARLRKIADELSKYAQHLEGAWTVEIGAGGPVLTMMSPVNRHERIAGRVRDQINQQIRATHPGWIAETGPEVEDPRLGRLRRPDVLVCDEEALDSDRDCLAPHEVLACIEVVSKSNPSNDYVDKMADYPAMGIGLYMIVDPRDGTITVHDEPYHGKYQSSKPYIFGDKVPFGPWGIDTTAFRRYGKGDE
ncbi:Uma2 family endonuclease [Streptomyces noursei]|uniref:Uma2 family endonuclease n=1 Tax=Streptomyces noursei TaxID=1971 RepID=UPI00081C5381|nr:Putative restriction endonuclease [Streptomyces noursei ATCC 11455]MCZ0996588.1 Uma2 family endonuclease [Streptomyces noursei]